VLYRTAETTATTVQSVPPPTVDLPVPKPVVVTKTAVNLAEHLDLRNLPLAATPGGKTYVIKALHPADSEIKTTRAPGGQLPTVAVASDMVETIPWPAGATEAVIYQTANIAYPMSLVFLDANGSMVDFYMWSNAAIGGLGLQHAPINDSDFLWMSTMRRQFTGHRVNAQSITCDVIAPALSDQGTIVSSQFVYKPVTANTSWFSGSGGTISSINLGRDIWGYNGVPNASQALMGTNAYTSKARDGFYQPLKLQGSKWVNTCDGFLPIDLTTYIALDSAMPNQMSNFPIYCNFRSINAITAPFPKPSCHTIGVTYIEGTAGSPSVSLRIRARQVCEIQPVIGGTYAPLTEAPYPPDELAYKMLAEIAGRMKDAYPASYNATGALKETIAKIGNNVLKFADPLLDVLTMIPGAGTVVGGIKTAARVGKAVSNVAKAVKSSKRGGQPQDVPPPPPKDAAHGWTGPTSSKKRSRRRRRN